jgi:DNA-binding PadR family transcriptional regulator
MKVETAMGKRDIIILCILFSEEKLQLRKIVEKLRQADIDNKASRIVLYQRLEELARKNLVKISWSKTTKLYKQMKFYKISTEGKAEIMLIKNQLERISAA